MAERAQDSYWNLDRELGDGLIQGEVYTIRARIHTALEPYRAHEELLPLRQRTGQRLYIQAQSYILVPDFTLTVALQPPPLSRAGIGRVVDSEWEGMRHWKLGQAQVWGYPIDRVAVLWECYLEEWCRAQDPEGDPNLTVVWAGLERLITEQLPGLERIATPSWEDLYELDRWQEFLRAQGYQRLSERAFGKEISPSRRSGSP